MECDHLKGASGWALGTVFQSIPVISDLYMVTITHSLLLLLLNTHLFRSMLSVTSDDVVRASDRSGSALISMICTLQVPTLGSQSTERLTLMNHQDSTEEPNLSPMSLRTLPLTAEDRYTSPPYAQV